MITRDIIEDCFPDYVAVTDEVLRFQMETYAETTTYYLECTHALNRDLLLVTDGAEDDEFALAILTEAKAVTGALPTLSKHTLSVSNKYGFTHFLLAPPDFHGTFGGILDDERTSLYLVVPIYNCEYAGDESVEVFSEIRLRYNSASNWQRDVIPRIMRKHDNPKTGGGTWSVGRVLERFSVIEDELQQLNGIASGYLEIESFRGDVVEIISLEPNTYTFRCDQESEAREMDEEGVIAETLRFLTVDEWGDSSCTEKQTAAKKKIKYFYYEEESHQAETVERMGDAERVMQHWKHGSRAPGTFFGIFCSDDVILQFKWEDEDMLSLDVPVPDKGGSFGKTATFAECSEALEKACAGADPKDIPGLKFQKF